MADTQEIFKQHLIKDEVQTNFRKDILHISVNYKSCSFLHGLVNPTEESTTANLSSPFGLYY